MGGLSGNDEHYRTMTTAKVARIYTETNGQMEIIGVGGVNNSQTALDKIKAGARAIQVVTAIREIGTTLPGRINRGLVEWMDRNGVTNITDIIGINTRRINT
jgi:dihydroorotate dehydrogenase